jgi:hypothetical protein
MKTNPRARRRRWPWIVAAGLLAAAGLVAVALPQLVDLERHRGRIERALGDATGWEASLGRLDLSVLRGLALTVSPVQLQAPAGGSSVDVGRVAIRAKILPLLRGELNVRSVVLLRPAIKLVRLDEEQGWSLPLPASDSGPHDSPFSVTIDGIDIRDGTLRLEDHSVEPPLFLAIEDLDIDFQPVDGSLQGSGKLAGDGGRLRWSGSVAEGLQWQFDDVRTEALGGWLGEGLLQPGGLLAGDISIDLPHTVAGRLTAEGLGLGGGVGTLRQTELDFRIASVDGGWHFEQLDIRSGAAVVSGRGSLAPLALELELQPTPLQVALDLARALAPLELGLDPPGTVAFTARLDALQGGELSFDARGQVSAGGFALGEPLPALTAVRTSFQLTRAGSLELEIHEATLGGGTLQGQVHIDRLDPPGTLLFEGELAGASLGSLLGGLVERAPELLTGPTAMRGKIAVDLSAETLDASSLEGQLWLRSDQVSVSGWDLEGSLRQSLREKLGVLAEVAALADPDLRKALAREEETTTEDRLLDRLVAAISFDRAPWELQTVELVGGGIAARGTGSFDPFGAALDLRLTAELDEALTARYLTRYPRIRAMTNDRGLLSLPLRLRGSVTGPKIEVELDRLLSDTLAVKEPEDLVKGLLQGLIDKQFSRKN